MKKEDSVRIHGREGIGAPHPGSKLAIDDPEHAYSGVNPIVYSTPSGSAYPSEPILTSKVSGWIGVFGDHYLCQLGCKRYASKRLDDVIKFFEREVRLWYKAKELAKKGKLDVAVKGHVRKSRKKKGLISDMAIGLKLGLELQKDKKEEEMDEVDKEQALMTDDQVKVSDEVGKGKVLFVKDENIKVSPKKKSRKALDFSDPSTSTSGR